MDKPDQQDETDRQNKSTGEGIEKAEYQNMSFWVINRTNARFVLEDSRLSWGRWMESPRSIPPNYTEWCLAFRSSGRAHWLEGTEGWVRYSSDQKSVRFIVKWEVPFTGQGYLNVVCDGEGCSSYRFDITHYDPSSSDPNPILTISMK